MKLKADANQTIYNNVLEEARKYLTELELNFLKLSLSIRAYSPAIEASRKVFNYCNSKKNLSHYLTLFKL